MLFIKNDQISMFVQHNNGTNNKCTQTFSSKDKDKFKQYGGGVQIIDGVKTYTQNVNSNETGYQHVSSSSSSSDDDDDARINSQFIQNITGSNAMGFQAQNMTFHGDGKFTQNITNGMGFQAQHMTFTNYK